MKKILSLLIVIGVLNGADCTRDDSAKIVSCTDTNLMWQDSEEVKKDTNKKAWKDAVNHCEDLVFANYSDWRLPNVRELQSIVDDKKYNPSIKDGFINVEPKDYWSSTNDASHPTTNTYAWNIGFKEGDSSPDGKNSTNFIRCVRGK